VGPSELMRIAVDVVERLGLRYFITGSMASMRYGEVRFTNDIDIVIELPPSRVGELCDSFPPEDYYVSEEAARSAALRGGQFNVIRPDAGLKVDFIVTPGGSAQHARFDRAVRLPTDDGGAAVFTSAEDSIVSKLDSFLEGESEKHLRDIASILKISGDQLDLAYISKWATEAGLNEVWAKLLARTGHS
jgi:hypothetical protein